MTKRLTIFAKGNVDVHDTLHSCRIGGELVWNGINAVLRLARPGTVARVQHETYTRSDALLSQTGELPPQIVERGLDLGSYPLESQFKTRLFDADPDAFVLSLQPDIATGLVRSRADGRLFFPSEAASWRDHDRAWLRREFEPIGHLSPAQSISNLEALVGRIRERSEAPILIYNVSPIVPGEEIHNYQGLGETISTRIRKFNLGLVELSEKTGISIVDVDALVAREGADRLKLDVIHLTAQGNERVAREVVRILDDIGLFEGASA